ncbi:MAG: flagellar hook-length control protein FliK [Clostridiales bacterium]|jgi:hypothetical protein|nr:flagellar hook-length control protein FliK [Clostridiales bacterium]
MEVNMNLTNRPQTAQISGASSDTSVKTSAPLKDGGTINGHISDIRGDKLTVKMADGSEITGKTENTAGLHIGDRQSFKVTVKDGEVLLTANNPSGEELNGKVLGDILKTYGMKPTQENIKMLEFLLKNQLPATQENLKFINQAFKLLGASEAKTAFFLENQIKLNVKNADLVSNLAQHKTVFGTQLENLFNSVLELPDGALKESILRDLLGGNAAAGEAAGTGSAANSGTAAGGAGNPGTAAGNAAANSGEVLANALADSIVAAGTEANSGTAAANAAGSAGNTAANAAGNAGNTAANSGAVLANALADSGTAASSAASANAAGNTANSGAEITGEANEVNQSGQVSANAGDVNEEANRNALKLIKDSLTGIFTQADSQTLTPEALSNSIAEKLSEFAAKHAGQLPDEQVKNINSLIETAKNAESGKAVNTRETLELLSKLLPDEADAAMRQKISESLKNISENRQIKDALLNKFLLNPEDLTKDELASRMREIKETLSAIAEKHGENPLTSKVMSEIRNIADNLTLLSNIKENTFIQIPLILNSNRATGELYIFKDKKKKKTGAQDVSALIALDTANLGRFEAYIVKQGRNVNFQFRLNNAECEKTIKENIHLLNDALNAHNLVISGVSYKKITERFSLLDKQPAGADEGEKPFDISEFIFDKRT